MLRIFGFLLLAIPFVPVHRIFGEAKGAGAYLPPEEWTLGLAIFGVAAFLCASALENRILTVVNRTSLFLQERRPALLGAAGILALAAILLTVSWFVFRHRPHLVDSVVQLFQAKIFASGLVEAPLPPARAFFATLHMVFDETGWYSQYPPGHSLLLTPGVWLGVSWLVPVLLTIGSGCLLVAFTFLVWDRSTATLTGILLLICPFFWFMGASFMNHVSTLFFVSATLFCVARWESKGGARWAALAGAALGWGFLSRPLTAVAIGLVLGVGVLIDRRGWRATAGGILAFSAVASVYLLFNAATTGDPLVPGYVELWGSAHGLGFHLSPWGEMHGPMSGARNELLDLSLLNVFLFEWPVPSLLPLGVAMAAGWFSGDRWAGRLSAAFVMIPAAYFFYWHRDAFLGPRYLYSGIAFLIPLTARALVLGWSRIHGSTWGTWIPQGKLLRPINGGAFMTALIMLCVSYAVLWGIPQRFAIYATGLSSMKLDVVDQARGVGIERGVVFVATSWGNRLLARIYGLGVSASVAERVYRSSDHCRLQTLVDRALGEGWTPEILEGELLSTVVPKETLVSPTRLNGDPTIRLMPNQPLTERCLEELAHDRKGYTLYVPHLVENHPRLDSEWVVARDLHQDNVKLMTLYPDRPAYRYRPGRFERLE